MNATPAMSIHLDNAAATPCDPAALDAFRQAAEIHFANQEGSGHSSLQAAGAVATAGKELADSLLGSGSQNASVLWTNTGTAALAAAVEAALGVRSGAIVSTDIEHPALAHAIDKAAAARGLQVQRAKIGPDGQLNLKELEALLDPKTALVAIHHVQAETGAIQNLAAVRQMLDKAAPKAFFLADTTQSAFKLEIPWTAARLDLATVSGAKIGCPCGAALLFREDAKRLLGKWLRSLRSQEHRIGRCPPAACIALAFQAKALSESQTHRLDEINTVKSSFIAEIRAALGEKVRFTLPEELASPYILHLLIPGVQGATIVRMLGECGFSVAAGSACDAEAKSPSKTVLALGVPRVDAYSALRLSFWSNIKASDAKPFAEALARCVSAY